MTWTAHNLRNVRWLIVWAPLLPMPRLKRIEEYLLRRMSRNRVDDVRCEV